MNDERYRRWRQEFLREFEACSEVTDSVDSDVSPSGEYQLLKSVYKGKGTYSRRNRSTSCRRPNRSGR